MSVTNSTLSPGTQWKVRLPHRSNASPISVGDRIFVTAEPDLLTCISASAGKVLWERRTSYLDLENEPLLTSKVRALVKEASNIQLRNFIQDGLQLTHHPKMLSDLEDLPDRFRRPDVHLDAGYTTPTPVSDGKNVYVMLGNGLVTCFSLDGKRRWCVYPSKPTIRWGHASSPILCAGRLIVQTDECIALRPETGSEMWRMPVRRRWASPIVVPGTPLIVLGGGEVIRVTDGKKLLDLFPHQESCDPFVDYWGASSPVVDGWTVYFVDSTPVTSWQAPPTVQRFDLEWRGSEVTGQLRWIQALPRGKYYASAIVHAGKLFAVASTIRTKQKDYDSILNKRADGTLLIFDKELGGLPSKTVELGRETGTYHTCSLVGDRLWITGHTGIVVIIDALGEHDELGRIELEPTRSHPLFINGDVVYRSSDSIMRLNFAAR